jgi:hypothetical protein
MNGVYFKVNGKGQYREYMNGSCVEASKAFNELIDRAKAKGFQKVCHSFGCSGVNLTFSDGKTRVELVYIKSDREYEWLMFFERNRMEREARENKAA